MEAALMNVLNVDALRHATVFRRPFSFLIAPGAVSAGVIRPVRDDFPVIEKPGLFPLSDLNDGPFFGALIDDLLGPEFTEALGGALEIDLAGRTPLVTVRGHCRERDGRIHNDSAQKVASRLLYLNDEHWDADGGRLRFLRDPLDMDSVVAEVPPTAGTLVAFRRSDNSWHGHRPYTGARRYVISWMAQPAAARREIARHRMSARFKAISGW